MAIDSYSSLKTAVAEHLDRDDLTDEIDDFIDLVEARNKQDVYLPGGTVLPPIMIREMIARSQATTEYDTASARFIELPDRFLGAVTLRLLTDPVTVLTNINIEQMNARRRENYGKPSFYTVHEEIEFDRPPEQAYTLETIFYQAVTPLSDANTSNAILARAPDVYLYGSLAAAAPFLHEDERIPTWNGAYLTGRAGLGGADRRGRTIGALVSQVHGTTP